MKDDALLEVLEQAAEMLEIKLGYEDLRKGEVNTDGGLFLLHGERRILIHKGLKVRERADVLARILSSLDTAGVHLPPAVRKRIDEVRDSGRAPRTPEAETSGAPAPPAPLEG